MLLRFGNHFELVGPEIERKELVRCITNQSYYRANQKTKWHELQDGWTTFPYAREHLHLVTSLVSFATDASQADILPNSQMRSTWHSRGDEHNLNLGGMTFVSSKPQGKV